MPSIPLLLLVILANGIETIVGFGSTLIALTFGSFFVPLEALVALLVPLNLWISLYLAIRYWRNIRFQILVQHMLPWIAVGFPLGMLVFRRSAPSFIQTFFSSFLLIYAGLQLLRLLRTDSISERQGFGARFLDAFLLFSGGFMQGLYGTGGPMIVAFGKKKLPDRNDFRATLAFLWLCLNIILTWSYWTSGRIAQSEAMQSLLLVPGLLIGIVLGEGVAKRLSTRQFELLVYLLLVGGATANLIRSL